MAEQFDIVKKTFSDAFGFLKTSWKGLIIDLVKIMALEWAVYLIALTFILTIAIIGAGGFDLQNIIAAANNLGFMIMAIAIIFVCVIISAVFGSVMINAVDCRYNGIRTPIIEKFKKNFVSYAMYTLLIYFLMVVMLLPFFLGYYGFVSTAPGVESLGMLCCFGLVSFVLFILFAFLTQVARFELVLGGAGPLECLKQSYNLIRKNLVAVIIFDVVYLIIAVIIAIPQNIVQRILVLVGPTVLFTSIAVLLLIVITYLVTLALFQLITFAITLPLLYFFWKGLKEQPQVEKKEVKTEMKEEALVKPAKAIPVPASKKAAVKSGKTTKK